MILRRLKGASNRPMTVNRFSNQSINQLQSEMSGHCCAVKNDVSGDNGRRADGNEGLKK